MLYTWRGQLHYIKIKAWNNNNQAIVPIFLSLDPQQISQGLSFHSILSKVILYITSLIEISFSINSTNIFFGPPLPLCVPLT